MLAIQKAVAHNTAPERYPIGDPKSLEHAFLSYFETLPSDRKQRAAHAVTKLINAPMVERSRKYGPLSKVDFGVHTAIAEQARSIAFPEKLNINLHQLKKDFEFHGPGLIRGTRGQTGLRPQQSGNIVGLAITNIHCDSVTGWFGIADDEIYLGGVTVDTLGNVNQIVPFDFGSFSSGTDRGVPGLFASFEIETQHNWPKAYSVTFVLAERHSGGIYDFVYKLAEEAKGQVIQALTSAAAAGGVPSRHPGMARLGTAWRASKLWPSGGGGGWHAH
jgi:hypothetical protein